MSFLTRSQSLMSPSLSIDARVHYGFIVAHTTSMRHLQTGHFPVYELNLTRYSQGRKKWESLYNFPYTGIGYLYSGLAKNKYLGSAQALFAYIGLPVLKKENFQVNFRIGPGIGYIQKPYDRLTNYKNRAIGSRINGAVGLLPEAKFFAHKKLSMALGAGLVHFSNGAFKTPNLGINIVTAHAGIIYNIGRTTQTIIPDTHITAPEKVVYSLIIAGGLKENSPPGGKKFGAYTVSANVFKQVSNKSTIGAGAEFFYDGSIIKQFEYDSVFNAKRKDALRAGVKASYSLLIGKLALPLEAGVYIHTPYKKDGYFYHRIGLRYKLTEHLVANMTLKTHFAVADYFEFGLGYSF